MRKINLEIYKERIKYLYADEGRSLIKIAKEIKASAGTIRKNMILWGINRRPTRKRNLKKPIKEDLKSTYYNEENIEEILKKLNVSTTTLFRWLKEYEISPSRRFIYKKTDFLGGNQEKEYILGLVAGDIHVRKHSRQILAELTSTHPAMIDLFFNVFQKYGTPKKYLKYNKKTERHEWRAYILLDSSFGFMLLNNWDVNKSLYSFLAGFFDCEGCIYVYNNHSKIGLSWLVYNSNKELLQKIKQRLEKEGFHPKLNKYFEKGQDTTQGYKRGTDIWTLAIYTKKEVIKLMNTLPIKHREKIEKFKLIEPLANQDWESVNAKLKEFRGKLKLEVQNFIKPEKNEDSTILPQIEK